MRLNAGVTGIIVAALLLSCSGQDAVPRAHRDVSLAPLYGTLASDLQLSVSGDVVNVTLGNIGSEGSYGRVSTPTANTLTEPCLHVSDGLLCAAIPNGDAIDIGVIPVDEAHASSTTISIELSSSDKIPSTPPLGSANRVVDLTVSDVDGEQVALRWTEVNTGDYDFNGEVNIADVAPVAKYFGQSYDTGLEGAQDSTLYWVDGDRNGEINISDLIPLGVNFRHQIAGYYVLHNGVPVTEPDSQQPLLFSRESATFRPPPDGLPPLYSTILSGSVNDSWSVVPVDSEGNQGSISIGTIIGNKIDAKASVIISGINLWQFEGTGSSSFDGGFSLLRVILPGDDVDWMEIGDKYVESSGVAVFSGLPKDTTLFLEIAYAPKTDLLTGEPVARDEAITNPFRTRMPFVLPDVEGQVEFAPEIEVTSREEGLAIDLFTRLTTTEGTEKYHSQLLLPEGLVSYDTDGDASFVDQAFLTDGNYDSVSDARIRLALDERDYAGGTRRDTRHKGTVQLFDEAGGYLVLSDAMFFDDELGWTPAPYGEIAYNFSELTEFGETGLTFIDPSSIVEGQELEVRGYVLSDLVAGLSPTYWANRVTRISQP